MDFPALPFVLRLAWRDSRRSRGRLALYGASLVLGVACLVAVGSLARSLARAVDQQARTLLGADLVLETRRAWTPEDEAFLAGLGAAETTRETAFSSMALFPKGGGTRLAQVRAFAGRFPLHGRLDTAPPEAVSAFAAGRGALVEEALMLQFGAEPGDLIRIGGRDIPIVGTLRRVPGEAAVFAALAPRVLIPAEELDPALLARGSLVRWKAYLGFPRPEDAAAALRGSKAKLEELKLDATDLERSKRQLGRVFEQVAAFLSLVGFVALLLGGAGVAAGVAAHVRSRLRAAAILRCLGASSRQTLAVWLAQALALGVLGSLAGALLGAGLHALAPRLLAGALPSLTLDFAPSAAAILQGLAAGMTTCVLFALLPLLPLRRVPPLLALRADAAAEGIARRDPLRWLTALALLGALVLFPWWQSGSARFALGFAGALVIGALVLWVVARGLAWAARRFLPSGLPYAWRQGLANLHRPGNRTVLTMTTLGLGVALLLGLHLTQELLRRQFSAEGGGGAQPNLVFFDVRPDQVGEVRGALKQEGLPDFGATPVVTMRLASVKGRGVDALLADKARRTPNWVLSREYRSTFRAGLSPTEMLVAGRWVGRAEGGISAVVPISLEADIARDLGVAVGDEIAFDVQGVPLKARVASLRRVEWRRFSPNFFVVFPLGVLEEAPAFWIMVTRAENAAASGRAQAAVVRKFPNVSAVDLALIAGTIQDVVDKATTGVRFLSLFTIGTGLVVLVATVLTGRWDRAREAALLRTLGASRGSVFRVLAGEYLALGALAAGTGIVLAAGGAWAAATWVFEIPQVALAAIILPPALATAGVMMLLTLGVGLLTSRGVGRVPPLELLRAEG